MLPTCCIPKIVSILEPLPDLRSSPFTLKGAHGPGGESADEMSRYGGESPQIDELISSVCLHVTHLSTHTATAFVGGCQPPAEGRTCQVRKEGFVGPLRGVWGRNPQPYFETAQPMRRKALQSLLKA